MIDDRRLGQKKFDPLFSVTWSNTEYATSRGYRRIREILTPVLHPATCQE